MYDKLVELSTKLVGERSWAIVNKEINGARNAIKHANDDSEDVIEIEKNADIAMLSRAIANYVLLNGGDSATPQMLRVFEYLKVQDFG